MNPIIRFSLAISIISVIVVSTASARLVPVATLPVSGYRAVVNTNNSTLYIATCQAEGCGVVPYDMRHEGLLPFVRTYGTALFFNPLSNKLLAHDNDDMWVMDGVTYEVSPFYAPDEPRIALNGQGNRLFVAGNTNRLGPHGDIEAVRVNMYEADTHEFLGKRDFYYRQNTALAVDEGKNRLYVSLGNHYPPELAVLDATTLDIITVIPNVPVGTLNTALAINPITDRIYVNKYNGVNSPNNDDITVVDTFLNAVIATIEIPNPGSTIVAPRSGMVYLTTPAGGMVNVINRDDAIEATIQVGDGTGNHVSAVNPENGNVYVLHAGTDYQGIATIDPFRAEVTSEVDLGVRIRDIIVDGDLIFVISSEDTSYILCDKEEILSSIRDSPCK